MKTIIIILSIMCLVNAKTIKEQSVTYNIYNVKHSRQVVLNKELIKAKKTKNEAKIKYYTRLINNIK